MVTWSALPLRTPPCIKRKLWLQAHQYQQGLMTSLSSWCRAKLLWNITEILWKSPLPCNYAKCNRKSICGAKLEKNRNSSQLYRALHQAAEASMTIGMKQYVKEPLSRSKCTVLVTSTHIASAPCSVRSVACVVLDFCMARSSLTSFKKNEGLHCLCSKTWDFLLHCENVNIRLCSRA